MLADPLTDWQPRYRSPEWQRRVGGRRTPTRSHRQKAAGRNGWQHSGRSDKPSLGHLPRFTAGSSRVGCRSAPRSRSSPSSRRSSRTWDCGPAHRLGHPRRDRRGRRPERTQLIAAGAAECSGPRGPASPGLCGQRQSGLIDWVNAWTTPSDEPRGRVHWAWRATVDHKGHALDPKRGVWMPHVYEGCRQDRLSSSSRAARGARDAQVAGQLVGAQGGWGAHRVHGASSADCAAAGTVFEPTPRTPRRRTSPFMPACLRLVARRWQRRRVASTVQPSKHQSP